MDMFGRLLDNPVAIAAILAACITALVGVGQIASTQGQANKRPFLEKQLEVCFEITDVVAALATATVMDEWQAARQKFWKLYWGRLSIVENRAIEAAMVSIGRELESYGQNPSLPVSSLRPLSYELAHEARRLILRAWNVDLGV